MLGVVGWVCADEIDGLGGEVRGVDVEVGILICGYDRKRGIACAGADLKHHCGAMRRGSEGAQDRKFLLQPLAVFEEVGCVICVEFVPPFGGVGVEALFVKGGDGGGALGCVLGFGVGGVGGRGGDVVPGVEFVDVVFLGKIAGPELEGVAAFQVVEWGVGPVRWSRGSLEVEGDFFGGGRGGWWGE